MAATRADTRRVLQLLTRRIARAVPAAAFDWLNQAVHETSNAPGEATLLRALGLAPRRLGRGDLILAESDLREADDVRAGWDPTGLSVDQAARIALVLATYRGDDPAFGGTLELLCGTAEINELIAYYRGLAIFPAPERLRTLAGAGV